MSGFFLPATLEQVQAASDIVDVIGSYVNLKRNGANFVALCPFHNEKSPSFNVSPTVQRYHCFGCHKGGNVFTFVKDYENIPFPDAVRRLAERASIRLEVDNNPATQISRGIKDSLLLIHEQITQRWQNCLAGDAAGEPARVYLKQRGVSKEAIELFRLGFAPEVWDDTVNWSKSKGHDIGLMEQSGLILKRDGGGYYDRFRGRLIFPICDEQGRVIGFSGRVLQSDVKTAKYVNSPETPIFTKGKVFFGLDKSKRPLLSEKSAVVCEGQLDLIRCFISGVQNIVAPQGTALTADHARILKRYVDEVVLCFDSDNAGQNAAIRSLDSLLASGLAIRVAKVPEPHDPDSFIKNFGADAFKEIIRKAPGFFDYYLNHLCQVNDLKSDKGRLAVLEGMGEAVHKTGNVVLIDTYAQKTALRLAVEPESVRAEFRKAARMKKPSPTFGGNEASAEEVSDEKSMEPESAPEVRPSPLEVWLLKLVLIQAESVPYIRTYLDKGWIENELVKDILAKWQELHQENPEPRLSELESMCDSPMARSLITEVTVEDRPVPNAMQQLADLIRRLRDLSIDRRFNMLRHRISQPDLTASEMAEISHLLKELPLSKRAPLTPLENIPEEPF